MVSFRQITKSLQHHIYKIDIFGAPLNLQIKKEQQFHTLFGLVVSCGILIFVYYSAISLLIRLFQKQNPNVVQNTQYEQNPEEYILDTNSFMFAIALTDLKGVPYTITEGSYLYTVTLQSCTREKHSLLNVTSICDTFVLKPCLSLNFTSDIYKQMNLTQATLAASVCLDPDQWSQAQMSFKGTPQSQIFKSLFFTLSQCQNDTMNNQCASQDEIDTKLDQAYIAVILSDQLLNQQLVGNPYQTVAKLTSTTISTSQFKSLTILMRKSSVRDTENFYYYFGSTTKQYQALQVDHSQEYVDSIKRSSIIQVSVYLDDRENIYYRTFDNILNIFGNISGLMQFMTLIAGLFVNPINELSQQLFLASEIYQIENKNNKTLVHPDLSFTESENDQLRLQKLKKYFKLKTSQIQMNVLNYLTYSGQGRKSINSGINQIYRKIDVIYFLNKMIEIDKLKKLIFDEDQQTLFNYIHKPKIHLTKLHRGKSNSFYENEDDTFEQKISAAYEAYKRIKENDQLINRNLISFMDKDIKSLFDGQIQSGRQNNSQQQIDQSIQKQDTMIIEMINPE